MRKVCSQILILSSAFLILNPDCFGQTPITEPTIDHRIPEEVLDGDGDPLPVEVGQLPLDFFDNFSWQMFVALNWPAVADKRGVPDTTKTIKDPGRRVWEAWKSAYEIVQPNGAQPSHWESLDAETPCPSISAENSALKRVIGTFAKSGFGDFNQVGFGNTIGPLVCQNKTYTRFEVRVNKQEFDFIRDNKLYLKSVLDKRALSKLPLRFPNGSIEVKAAWREFTSDETQELIDTFYSITAQVYDPVDQVCREKKLGLVGLHIVHKTPLRPQWIWSSFEHISNVPKHGTTPDQNDKFSYNDPSKEQETDSPAAPVTVDNEPVADPTPTQVIREFKLHPSAGGNVGTVAMNQRYQQELAGSVWANYQLVTTQWPRETHNPGVSPPDNIAGDPFPAMIQNPADPNSVSVSNTTMESYVQGTSCMACHNVARRKNLDFVFFLDFHAFDDTGLAGAKPNSLNDLKNLIKSIQNLKSNHADNE